MCLKLEKKQRCEFLQQAASVLLHLASFPPVQCGLISYAFIHVYVDSGWHHNSHIVVTYFENQPCIFRGSFVRKHEKLPIFPNLDRTYLTGLFFQEEFIKVRL